MNNATKLKEDLDIAIEMLAEWVVAIDEGGSGWDYWDEHYKNAAYRDTPIRKRLDEEILRIRQGHIYA